MIETSVPVYLGTLAFVGGEKRRSLACILSLPRGCTEVHIGDEKLNLLGKWEDSGFKRIDDGEVGVSAAVELPPGVVDQIGRLGILFTGRGEIFFNRTWLGSGEFGHVMSFGKRKLLRWLYCLPGTLRQEQPDFFVSHKQQISLN